MRITKKQLAFIDDIFNEGLSESQAIEKYGIDTNTYRKWLANDNYKAEIAHRLDAARREEQILIARHCGYAAAKLISLASSDKEETARKACLDIMEQSRTLTEKKNCATEAKTQDEYNKIELSAGDCKKILNILAGERC